MPITVKARDGKTDLYGLLFRPTNFDPSKKYPIINHIYPGPQTGSVGSRTLLAGARRHAGARRARLRRRAKSTAWARRAARRSSTRRTTANMGDNTLPDQVAGMKELARALSVDRHRRAGHLGPLGRRLRDGGAMFQLSGLLQGRHLGVGQPRQPRLRRRLGREVAGPARRRSPTARPTTTTRPIRRSPKNLKGKLLLAHGTMDDNVPPYNTLLVVDALIKANKDFDLLMLPNQAHGFGSMPTT